MSIKPASLTLYHSPVFGYEDGDTDVSNEVDGIMSLRSARKLLGGNLEGAELKVRMFEAGSHPQDSEVYEEDLRVERLSDSQRKSIPDSSADPLLLNEVPEGFSYGGYDFTVLGVTIPEYNDSESVDLEEWR